MVVGGSQLETLDKSFVLLGTRQQGVPVILRELMLPAGFDPVSLSFIVRDECQVARNPGLGFPVDYLQPSSVVL
ncbi:unnamed protein product [Schistosoma margrebowiei]|uniref:Uncharacterized protein n=1 Tax=Schistosoma margrebowiei TaxID=48269 RepID=A0A183LVG5_9TREM|nr:unnamed protein product [Schistosoma margrebowiei]